MAAIAISMCDEGNTIVTFPAKISTKNVFHADGRSACLLRKRIRMTVHAVQPFGMSPVRKPHVRHLLGIAHDDIQLKRRFARRAIEPFARRDFFRAQRIHPVNLTVTIDGQTIQRLARSLQTFVAGVIVIVERIALATLLHNARHWTRRRLRCRSLGWRHLDRPQPRRSPLHTGSEKRSRRHTGELRFLNFHHAIIINIIKLRLQ